MAGQVPHKLHTILSSKEGMLVSVHVLARQQYARHGKAEPLSGETDQLNERVPTVQCNMHAVAASVPLKWQYGLIGKKLQDWAEQIR